MSDHSNPSPDSPLTGDVLCNSARPSRRTARSAFHSEPPDPGDPLLGFAPYLHAASRRNSITPERQRAFIAALAATGIVTQAARVIGASLEALYRLRNMPGAQGFAAAWEAAIDRGMARLRIVRSSGRLPARSAWWCAAARWWRGRTAMTPGCSSSCYASAVRSVIIPELHISPICAPATRSTSGSRPNGGLRPLVIRTRPSPRSTNGLMI